MCITKEQKENRIKLPPLSNNNTNAASRKGLFKKNGGMTYVAA